ncbi:phosphoribosylamine--glycine ligase [Humitalea sp. 24SJ18S-53]|uniref:phosphoribosylamine--glycine ligase n=1 Tax=Humitalea sp. 24SJ18S-53 TaxID=3422307 RepID=UPI003D6759B1
MIRSSALIACLLLAACGPRAAGQIHLNDTPEVAACRAEARRDPGVIAANRSMNIQNRDNMDRVRAEVAEAERRSFNACLRREGLPLPGGVEAPTRRLSAF